LPVSAPPSIRRPKSRIWSDVEVTEPPDYLDGEMTISQLCDALEHLPFRRSGWPGQVQISIDRHVRDYFLRAIRNK